MTAPLVFEVQTMLRALTIRDFAIIDHIELELGPGFGVITGETGAGKSILVDALSLLIGARAEASMVAAGKAHADLSAYFELDPTSPATKWLQANAMAEDEPVVLIRRTVQAQGGSRGWINGHPATASQLKDLGSLLVEIHGQHAHQQLSRSEHQRALLDTQCAKALKDAVKHTHHSWHEAKLALEQFEADMGDPSQIELLSFHVQELQALDLQPGEYETLEAEQEKLQRQDEIQAAIAAAKRALDQDEAPAARGCVHQAKTAIAPIASLDPRLGNVYQLLEDTGIALTEAAAELDQLASTTHEDPQTLNEINNRLAAALDLARKHRIKPHELPKLTDSLTARLEKMSDQDHQRTSLTQAITAAESDWSKAAKALSEARYASASAVSTKVTQALHQLGMDHASLVLDINSDPTRAPSPWGFDEVKILFTANPGQPPQALQKVASGGELSRISLALMLALGERSSPMTRIFDEVDAGIGGETAHAVGDFLKKIGQAQGRSSQALCVTHLAQVAARADQHFQVHKTQTDGTHVAISTLSEAERPIEIARMLGNPESKKGLAHAREMIAAHLGKAT